MKTCFLKYVQETIDTLSWQLFLEPLSYGKFAQVVDQSYEYHNSHPSFGVTRWRDNHNVPIIFIIFFFVENGFSVTKQIVQFTVQASTKENTIELSEAFWYRKNSLHAFMEEMLESVKRKGQFVICIQQVIHAPPLIIFIVSNPKKKCIAPKSLKDLTKWIAYSILPKLVQLAMA